MIWDATYNHYGKEWAPQWQLTFFEATPPVPAIISLFFKGTGARLQDITIDLDVRHQEIKLKNISVKLTDYT